jgi:hypothetical protein
MSGKFAALFLFLVGVCVFPVAGQKVATKDGKIIQFRSYRVTEKRLLYIDENGKESAVSISDIDLTRTHELNVNEESPPILPGMTGPAKSADAEPSLGEMARRTRASQKLNATKHVYTDDDVAHAARADEAATSPAPQDFGSRVGKAQKAIDQWREKTPRGLSDGVVDQNQFPGRDNWEQRLYQQKEKMITAAQACLIAAQKLTNAPTQEERNAAQKAAASLLSDFDLESSKFNRIIAEGVKKAGEWERYHR